MQIIIYANNSRDIMRIKLIIALLILLILAGCVTGGRFEYSEKIPCKECSDKLLQFMECSDLCKARAENATGTVIFGKTITGLSGFKKEIRITHEKGKEVSCVCTYVTE